MAPVAPLVAGHWPRRLGGLPGPYAGPGGSGDSPNGQVLQVELFVDGTWVDITSYVMTRDGSYNVSISRGQPNEAARTEPGRCSFQLNNRDGRFSPRNPTGPYFGKLGRNQPLRVSVPSGDTKSYRFWGEVPAWPQYWDTTGTDVWVEVQAAGILRRLGQGSAPIGSTMYLAFTSGSNASSVYAYWPCEDGSKSTSIGSAVSDAEPMSISGTPSLAAFSQFACSGSIPTMGTASFTGLVPTYTAPASISVGFLLAVPAATVAAQTICRFETTGTVPRWEIYYDPMDIGFLGLRGKNSSGGTVVDSGLSVGFINGKLNQITATLEVDSGTLNATLYRTEVDSTEINSTLATTAASTAGLVTSVTMAPDGTMADTAMGHVCVRSAGFWDLFDLVDSINAYSGEAAGRRVSRLCDLKSVSFDNVGTLSASPTMGSQLSSTLLDLITQSVEVDNGILYEQAAGLGLGYRTRLSMENQSSVLALSYSGFNLSEVPVPSDDDQYTRNDITVTRTNGSSSRATLDSGPLSTQPAPAGIGQYDDAVTLNIEEDSTLPDQAGWRLHLGTVDEARYPQISVNLAHSSFTGNPTLRNQVLAVRPGDRITISGQFPSQAPDDISQLVLGFSETIDHFEHRITFNCRPESPYRTALFDSTTVGRLDTDGSQLAQDVAASGTSLLVKTLSGPVWTTTDTPFDITVSGERITVTAVSGATSPQTFTVTRAVNGVVKPLTQGADVRLYQPMILGL